MIQRRLCRWENQLREVGSFLMDLLVVLAPSQVDVWHFWTINSISGGFLLEMSLRPHTSSGPLNVTFWKGNFLFKENLFWWNLIISPGSLLVVFEKPRLDPWHYTIEINHSCIGKYNIYMDPMDKEVKLPSFMGIMTHSIHLWYMYLHLAIHVGKSTVCLMDGMGDNRHFYERYIVGCELPLSGCGFLLATRMTCEQWKKPVDL